MTGSCIGKCTQFFKQYIINRYEPRNHVKTDYFSAIQFVSFYDPLESTSILISNIMTVIYYFYRICDAAMGIQVNSQNESKNEYVHAIYEISELILHRMLRPWLFPDFIYKRCSAGKQFKHCLDILHNYTLDVIRNRKLSRKSNNTSESKEEKKRLAFLDLLLEANENRNLLTDDDIRTEVDTFMFEGMFVLDTICKHI